MTVPSTSHPLCVSFSMLFLDTLHFVDRPSVIDVLGGSATFATFGARLCAGDTNARDVGCIAVVGDDFPDDLLAKLRSWDLTLVVHQLPPGVKSTRGELTYLDKQFGDKTFRYTAPPQTPKAEYLADTPLLAVRAIHAFGRPAWLHENLVEMAASRVKVNLTRDPIIVYEPMPSACNHDQLDTILNIAKEVHVFSPNHLELLQLCEADFDISGYVFERGRIESHAKFLLDSMLSRPTTSEASSGSSSSSSGQENFYGTAADPATNRSLKAVIIRAGEHGSLLLTRAVSPIKDNNNNAPTDLLPIQQKWFPAYHGICSPDDDHKPVIDATGAGNAYLGAVTYVLASATRRAKNDHDGDDADQEPSVSEATSSVRTAAAAPWAASLTTRDFEDAVVHGAAAASLAIEQIGLPNMPPADAGPGFGCSVRDRVAVYRRRSGVCG